MQDKPTVVWMGEEVERFNREIIGYPIPTTPQVLDADRRKFRMDHVMEELTEFRDACEANNVEEAADAIIDLVYVALGALVEMGVCVQPVFAEVHRANMAKVRGTKPSRPDNQGGFDAVKPAGWKAPDHSWLHLLSPEAHHVIKTMALAHLGGSDLKVGEYTGAYIHLAENINEAQDTLAQQEKVTSVSVGDRMIESDGLTIGDLSPVLLEVTKVRVSKGKDYNTTVPLPEYFPFGHESYGQMLWTKVLRIRNLITIRRRKGNEGKPNHESLRDSVLDLINYSTYYAEAMDRGDKYLEG